MDNWNDLWQTAVAIGVIAGFATVLIMAIKLIAYLYEITIGKLVKKMLNKRFAKKTKSCTCQECHCDYSKLPYAHNVHVGNNEGDNLPKVDYVKNRNTDNDIKYTI